MRSKPPHAIQTRPEAPLAVAVALVLGKLEGKDLLGVGGMGSGTIVLSSVVETVEAVG